MARVKFIDVGRECVTWEEELVNVDERSLVQAIQRRKVLLSRDISVANSTIFAGFRAVGRTEIVSK